MSSLPFWKFLLATALGMTPGTFVFVYLGGASPGPGRYGALDALAALGVAAYRYFHHGLRPPKKFRASTNLATVPNAPDKDAELRQRSARRP